MNNLSIIVAKANNNVIGINNTLPWHLPEDLKRFRSLTMDHHIIMGRKTYEVICSFAEAWPYPNQKGFIVTSNPDLALTHASLSRWNLAVDELVEHLKQNYNGNVWIVGGTQLQNTFIEQKLLNTLEVFIMPVLLGKGIPLFPSFDSHEQQLKSIHAEMIENTIIKHSYVF